MPKPTKGRRLGGSPAHQRIILANLASQLFEHGRITTTVTKAKRVQPLAETMISKAKRGDLHSRRLVLSKIGNKSVVHTLFTEIAPRLADREGGYTRVTRIGNRQGDNAPMAVIEIVTETVEESRKARDKGRSAAAAKRPATPAPKRSSSTRASGPEFATVADMPTDAETVSEPARDEATYAGVEERVDEIPEPATEIPEVAEVGEVAEAAGASTTNPA